MSLGRLGGGWFGPLTIGLVVGDQALKIWMERRLAPGFSLEVLPGFFSLTRVHNTGVAFGMAQGNNLLTGLLAAGLLALSAWFAREWDWNRRSVQIVSALVAGGAVGNLVDRVRLGYVLDFLDFHYRNWSWPAFNLADACISTAVGLLLLNWILGRRGTKEL